MVYNECQCGYLNTCPMHTCRQTGCREHVKTTYLCPHENTNDTVYVMLVHAYCHQHEYSFPTIQYMIIGSKYEVLQLIYHLHDWQEREHVKCRDISKIIDLKHCNHKSKATNKKVSKAYLVRMAIEIIRTSGEWSDLLDSLSNDVKVYDQKNDQLITLKTKRLTRSVTQTIQQFFLLIRTFF